MLLFLFGVCASICEQNYTEVNNFSFQATDFINRGEAKQSRLKEIYCRKEIYSSQNNEINEHHLCLLDHYLSLS